MYIFMVDIEGRKKCNFMQWPEANARQIQIQRSILQTGSQQDNLPREAMDTYTPKIPIGVTHFIQRANILNLLFQKVRILSPQKA